MIKKIFNRKSSEKCFRKQINLCTFFHFLIYDLLFVLEVFFLLSKYPFVICIFLPKNDKHNSEALLSQNLRKLPTTGTGSTAPIQKDSSAHVFSSKSLQEKFMTSKRSKIASICKIYLPIFLTFILISSLWTIKSSKPLFLIPTLLRVRMPI